MFIVADLVSLREDDILFCYVTIMQYVMVLFFRSHCVLSKKLNPLLSTGSTKEAPSRHDWKSIDLDVKSQTKKGSKLIQRLTL